MQAFNDGVIAIIVTIIVLEIQPPTSHHYGSFVEDIGVFFIAFFVVTDFWYDLHLTFSTFILKPNKITAIVDFLFLADLSLVPVMTKWLIQSASSFAVANFSFIFLIAQILKGLVMYYGIKPSFTNINGIRDVFTHSSLWRMIVILIIDVALIVSSFIIPNLVIILYLIIPITSFFNPQNTVIKY